MQIYFSDGYTLPLAYSYFGGPVAFFDSNSGGQFEVELKAGSTYRFDGGSFLGYVASYVGPNGGSQIWDLPFNPTVSGVYKFTVSPKASYYTGVHFAIYDVSPSTNAQNIIGTSGRDIVEARGGNDKIEGLGGNDTINGGGGRDSIFGGDGDDSIYSTPVAYYENLKEIKRPDYVGDYIDGGSGNDWIFGGGGDDTLIGGAGNDLLVGNGGVNTVLYNGKFSDYKIERNVGGVFVDITDKNGDVDSVGVEFGNFGGSIYSLGAAGTTLLVSDSSIVEGDAGQSKMTFTASLSVLSAIDVRFSLSVRSKTAISGVDFGYVSTYYIMEAGNKSITIDVPIYGDTNVENDETFELKFYTLSGAHFQNDEEELIVTGTIKTDDIPTLSFTGGKIKEGASGTSVLSYTASLSYAPTTAVSFTVKSTGGTATAGSDYTAVDRTVTIAAGSKTATIEVSVAGDTRVEADETIVLTLSNIAGAKLADGAASFTATGTIQNDDYAPSFVLSAYKALNPDLVAAFGGNDAAYVRHYISNGKAEGRGSSGFDTEAYAALNPDLYKVFALNETALANHYRTNGLAEGRLAVGFDADAYAAMNPDLFAAFGTNHEALIRHYVNNGKAEGRVATGFDIDAYAALNPDLFRAFGLNANSLINHYVQRGKAEGRLSDGFDVDAYAALNPDLFAAFGLDQSALINHYINSGRAEGRAAMAPAATLVALGLPMEMDVV